MLALAAMIVFILGLFKVTIGTIDLMFLGLALLSAHFLFTAFGWYAWPGRKS